MRQSASGALPSAGPVRRRLSWTQGVRLHPYGGGGGGRVSPDRVSPGPARAAAPAGPVGVWNLNETGYSDVQLLSYEQKRMQNIARNRDKLRALGLDEKRALTARVALRLQA